MTLMPDWVMRPILTEHVVRTLTSPILGGPTVPEHLVRDTLDGMTTDEIAAVVDASLPVVTE